MVCSAACRISGGKLCHSSFKIAHILSTVNDKGCPFLHVRGEQHIQQIVHIVLLLQGFHKERVEILVWRLGGINHGNLITLADFYEVSIDYLFCRTENREQINTPLSELHLTDEAVELLKSGRINNRLLCEIVTNDKFEQLMTDTEIYIDGHATSTFRTLYESLEEQRQVIVQKYKQADRDFYSQTLLAAEVK